MKKKTKLHIMKLVERKCQEQDAAMQRKMVEATEIEHMEQTTSTPTKATEEGQEISMEQDIQGEEETLEYMDLTKKLTQLKWLHNQE